MATREQIQFIADDKGKATGVIVPISLWREIESERKKALKVIQLVQEIQSNPFSGTGKPEPLKHELAGCWSRRIDHEHRLVYQVFANKIRILSCKYHY